ncbi:MAG: amino acid deaminase [Rhodocyclaceae bacterium]
MQKGHVLATAGDRAANLLNEDVSLPAAVVDVRRLEGNLAWMQVFCNEHGVAFAPHGKTTMTPYIFRRQLAHGAWGLTIATAVQARAAHEAGCRRLLMANQLVGRANMEIVAELQTDPELQFYCLVDSPDNVAALDDVFSARRQTVRVLLEIGADGGRCGCRSPEQVHAVLDAIAKAQAVCLAGVELYEGVIHGDDAVPRIRAFLQKGMRLVADLQADGRFGVARPLFTAAGSAWYDIVADTVRDLPTSVLPVLRPGCYAIHDEGIYRDAQQAVLDRSPSACAIPGELSNCLEIWACVQSTPEPGQLIAGLGKRDAAFDAGLPQPLRHFRPDRDTHPQPLVGTGWRAERIMDQHLFVTFPADSDVKVGDLLAFGQSHPCLTMDKWRQIHLVNDRLDILETVETQF